MNKPVYISLSVLGISKMVIYEFWYHYVEAKCMKKKIMLHGYIQLYSLYKSSRHFLGLQKMLKQDLILQIINWKDHYLKEKIKKYLC